MANFDQLKQSVANVIRTNGAEEITGSIMQDVLLTIINSIAGGYMFGGVAQHNGNVGNPDYNVFYLAGSGSYTGYGGAITIEAGCYGVFRYNGSWTQEVVDIGVRLSGSIAPGETRGVTGDTINTALQTLFENVTAILDSLEFEYNTPSAQQATKAMLDVIVTPTGGSAHKLTTLTLVSATVAAAGLMSAEDKQKLDRMLTDFRSLSLDDTTQVADQASKIALTLSATLGENPEVIDTIMLLSATSSKAGLMSAADKAYLDELPTALTGLSNSISSALALMQSLVGYYTCDTAAGTAAKTISASGYSLTNGGCIRIKMTNANTAANVTLNINSTGAKALYYDGAQASSSNSWEAGEVLEVYYDGTQYQCASGSGKFATGEKVKNTSITNTLTSGSNALATSGAVYDDMVGIEASHYNSGGHINSSGAVSTSTYFVYSDYIPCQNGDAIEWYPSYSDGVYLALYDSNKTFIRAYNCTPATNLSFIISNSNAAFLRSSASSLRLSECYVKINGEYAWYPAGKAGIIDQKIAPIIERFNLNGMFEISGDNDNYAKSSLITGVIAGHTYRLGIKFPNIDMSGVTVTGTNYIRLAVKVFDGDTDTGNVVDVRIGTPLKDIYTFSIPSTVSNPSVQVWMRFTSGYKEYFCIEDSGAGGASSEWEPLNYSVIARRGAIWNTGVINTNLSSTSATDYVDVSGYKQIRCLMTRVNAVIDGASGGIVFYDANKAYLKGYYYRTVDGTNVAMSSTEVRVFDVPATAKYVIINMLNDHVSQFFADGRKNMEPEVKNGDDYYDKYANIGHPTIYRSLPTADAYESLNGKTVDDLYAEYDDLATRFPDYFRRTADIATVTKSNVSYVSRSYELRYNKYFQQTSEPTEGQIIDYDLNIWTGKYNPRKIIVISGMHGEEKTPTWGLMLSIKDILESNEEWALFIRANCVLAIAPCVNPSGWQDVVRTDSEGHDMNRDTSYADPECVGLLKWHYDNRDAEVAFDIHGSQGRYMYFPNANWYPMANIHNRFYGRLVVAMQNEWKTFYDSISQGYGTTYAPFMLLQQGNGESYPTSFASWSTRLAYKIGMQRLPLETPDSLSTGSRTTNDLRMCKLTKDMFINLLMIHIGVKDMPKNDINRQVVDMPEPGWNT